MKANSKKIQVFSIGDAWFLLLLLYAKLFMNMDFLFAHLFLEIGARIFDSNRFFLWNPIEFVVVSDKHQWLLASGFQL